MQCDFYLMTRTRSSYRIHIHYSQVKLGRTKYVSKVMKKTNEQLMPWDVVRGG